MPVRPRMELASASSFGLLFIQLLPCGIRRQRLGRPYDRQRKFPILGKIMSGTTRHRTVSATGAPWNAALSPHLVPFSIHPYHTLFPIAWPGRYYGAPPAGKHKEGNEGSRLHPEKALAVHHRPGERTSRRRGSCASVLISFQAGPPRRCNIRRLLPAASQDPRRQTTSFVDKPSL